MSRARETKVRAPMTRRRFLRDLGVSAAAVPLLVGLDSLYAKAQVATIPKKRFVFMFSPNGILYSAWRIPQAGTNIDISNGALLNDPARTLQPLSQNAGKLLVLDRLSLIGARPVFNDPGAPPLTIDGVTVQASSADGISHPGGDQKGMGNLLTGQVLKGGANNFGSAGLGNGISVDQVIANALFKGVVKFPSLQIAVMGVNDLYGYDDRQVEKGSLHRSRQSARPGERPVRPLQHSLRQRGPHDADRPAPADGQNRARRRTGGLHATAAESELRRLADPTATPAGAS